MGSAMEVARTAAWWAVAVALAGAGRAAAGRACLGDPCLHGICIDDINSTYSCYCVDGYTGVRCQTDWDECWSAPCLNGGVCSDGIASYNCSCADGFVGDNCEINYNECDSNPCGNNGTCLDLADGFLCVCAPGFSGERCQEDAAVCQEGGCHHGGRCLEGPGLKYYCDCLPGWAGSRCELAVDECESGPCMNGGVCIDVLADYMCACAYGFTGKSCEVEIEFCDENSCSNNALCVVEDGARICYCVPDFHGERCHLQYDECQLGPRCMNGGSCIDGVDNFTCSCPPGLVGTFCECLLLDNDTLQCDYVSPTSTASTRDVSTVTTLTDNATDFSSTTSEVTSQITEYEIRTTETTPIETTDMSSSETATEQQSTTETVPATSETTQSEMTTDSEHSITETTTDEAIQSSDEVTETELTTETIDVTSKVTASSEPTDPEKEGETESNTEKLDTTTDKMFTESPTEYSIIDTTAVSYAMSTSLSGEVFTDITTLENSTESVTTVLTECSDSVCNDRGSCEQHLHGPRCQCKFDYRGRFCEEKIMITAAAFGANSYLIHKLNNETSIYIKFEAKTLITDGQIMYVDIAEGVYIQLYMMAGLLKFKFSCGYQTMLLSELKTFVNKGYSMKIETRLDLYAPNQHCNATLRLNDTVAMSGGQVSNFSYLYRNTTLYLANAPNVRDTKTRSFIGCIMNLTVNNEKRAIFSEALEGAEVSECGSLSCLSGPCHHGGSCRDQQDNYTCACSNGWTGDHCEISVCDHNPCQFGASCLRHPGSGFLCLCPYGKHGIFCEYNVEISRPSFSSTPGGISSYLKYSLPQAVNSERFDLRFRFQTEDMDQISLLAFVGQNGLHNSKSQHLAVTFVKGYVMLTWNLGHGARRIFAPRALGSRRGGHWVRAGRRGRAAWLSVDGNFNVSGNAPGPDTKMTVAPYIYIGGHPSPEFRSLPHDLPLHSGWRGCVWELGGGGGGGRALSGRGVGQCGVAHCSAGSCNSPRGACIHHPATYGCICSEGWFGATCASPENPCNRARSPPCRGRCVLGAVRPACDCPYGTAGPHCNTELYPTEVSFSGVRSFARVSPRVVSGGSLSVSLEVRPAAARGLLLLLEGERFWCALSLQGALLDYRWTDRESGAQWSVRSGAVVSPGGARQVRAGRAGSRLYLWVDGALSAAGLPGAPAPPPGNVTILLGGAEDLSSLPPDVMSGPPESYSGCIRNLQVDNVPIPLDKYNIQAGMNLQQCAWSECGARCRRETCGAGLAGPHCLQKVSVPQFSGESFLWLPLTERLPDLQLNFTSLEPDGLLLWMTMDAEYLGVGLEGGRLKVVSSPPLSVRWGEAARAGEWHHLRAGRGAVRLGEGEDLALTHDKNYRQVNVYLGGSPAGEWRHHFGNYRGCMSSILRDSVPLHDFSLRTENIDQCRLPDSDNTAVL